MEMTSEWAESECRIACKGENPKFNFDGNEFDSRCESYKSALKAFKSLMEDEQKEMDFDLTKSILNRLLEGKPLTPITENDFVEGKGHIVSDDFLKRCGLKSFIQCTRLRSLYREETLGGEVRYRDAERSYFVDVDNPSRTYFTDCQFFDEMFPITIPYMPAVEPYKIYERTFLTDEKNGEFDTRNVMYVITPSGERVDLNLYFTEVDGKWKQITKDEYEELWSKRVDKASDDDYKESKKDCAK